jgi:hypothetical protein
VKKQVLKLEVAILRKLQESKYIYNYVPSIVKNRGMIYNFRSFIASLNSAELLETIAMINFIKFINVLISTNNYGCLFRLKFEAFLGFFVRVVG